MAETELTQTDLNEPLRGLTNVDILMFLPDPGVAFGTNAVTSNVTTLTYTTNLYSLVELANLPQAKIATFENNSWILDGSFISPSEAYSGGGASYSGYITDAMTDDNGDYETNPIITVQLAAGIPTVSYLSLQFAGGIDTSYPKTLKIRTYNASDTLIAEHSYNTEEQKSLPTLVAQVGDNNVKKVEFEFVGTICPHRRSRLNKIMFGRAEPVDNYYLQSWKIDDKASLVADSIPTKTLEYSIINYDGDYNIDKPGNKIPKDYRNVTILFTFSMEQNGLWKYAPTRAFNLLDISTTSDGIVTFKCGSLLDMLTETYDHDIYTGKQTISEVMYDLFTFSEIATDQYILNSFTDYEINIPIPEIPVREIIQRLAFSCGATLTVDDSNRVVFSMKNISPLQNTSVSKFMFHQPVPFSSAGVLLEEPSAEALAHTTNIAMCTYDTKVEITADPPEIATVNITTMNPTRISYPASQSIQIDNASLLAQHAEANFQGIPYTQHAFIQVQWDASLVSPPIDVKLKGNKINTTQTMPMYADMDTLILDSGMALTIPENISSKDCSDPTLLERTFFYDDWYGAKFKYKCKTRKEYLVRAGDIIYFETPFSNGEPSRMGYVLRNSYSGDGDSGEMEVVAIEPRNT